jgi:hypothetical protein
MDTKGLLVRLEVKTGKDDAMAEDVLRSALAMGRAEAATTTWFAIRFGRSEYGIFDVFPDDAGREAHATLEAHFWLEPRASDARILKTFGMPTGASARLPSAACWRIPPPASN